MRATRSGWVAVLCAVFGCTVGGDSNGTLSGGATASGGDEHGTEAPTTADDGTGSSDHGEGDATGAASATAATSDAGTDVDEDSSAGDSAGTTGDGTSSGAAGSSSEGGDDLDDGILDVTIIAHDDCTITTIPASITVPLGTEFTVNWISAATSEAPVDVAKIDAFNAVPIILDMEPGTSYHDEIREWCGDLFTGTFDFEITSCFDPQSIPVDCGG